MNPTASPSALSYIAPTAHSPWNTYLSQVDRVIPYLGHLARWAETLKRPKRALIVDVPIELDDGNVAHFEGFRVQHNLSRGPGQGRRALPPRCHARGGDGAGRLDVGEERRGEPAVRRAPRAASVSTPRSSRTRSSSA